jgi:Protein of unknown function (DUF4085)
VRYFTRELYDSTQDVMCRIDEPEFEAREPEVLRKCDEVSQRYLAYLRECGARLTGAVRELTSFALHDARITRVRRDPDSVELLLDTRYAPLAKGPSFRVHFVGVRDAHGLDDVGGRTILDWEVYVRDDGRFEFSALCDRFEFSVHFADVAISPTRDPERAQRGRGERGLT